MKIGSFLLLAVLAGCGAVLAASLYTIDETQQVIITQFGRPIGEAVTKPGLHLKVPFVQEVNVFDKRWLEWSGDANQIPTRDKKYIWVDTFARWRIVDPLRFFQRLRDERGAQSRLDDIIDGETRNVIANHNLIEAVRTSNREFEKGDDSSNIGEAEEMKKAELGRDKLTREILERAAKGTDEYGIELVDVQIRRVNYISTVQKKVFERMISERKRIADRHRSEGQGRSAEIRGKKERELKKIQSEAYKTEQEIMGKADAKAAAIYANAYNADRELYRFVKTMETYKSTIGKDSMLIMSTGAEMMQYFNSMGGGVSGR